MATTSKKAAEIAGKPSLNDVRQMISRALFGDGPDDGWVVDITDTDAVVYRGGTNFRYPYTLNEAGDGVVLGTPVEVTLSWRDKEMVATEPLCFSENNHLGLMVAGDGDEHHLLFVNDLRGLSFQEGEKPEVWVQICRDGKWKHPRYGDIEITPAVRKQFADNFQSGVRRIDLAVDYNHQSGPAAGWFRDVKNEGNATFALMEFTPRAAEQIRAGEYRYFSPEWVENYTDPETGKSHGATLLGGGLTNRPYFKGMQAITCSEAPNGGAGEEHQMVDNKTIPPAGGQPDNQPPAAPVQDGNRQATEDLERRFQAAEDRLKAVEMENAALKAAETRRAVEDEIAGLKFSEGRQTIAPASRTSLTDIAMKLPEADRKAFVEAIKGLQFVEYGERGFTPADSTGDVTLTAEEERDLQAMAQQRNLKFEDVKANYIETKRQREQMFRQARAV